MSLAFTKASSGIHCDTVRNGYSQTFCIALVGQDIHKKGIGRCGRLPFGSATIGPCRIGCAMEQRAISLSFGKAAFGLALILLASKGSAAVVEPPTSSAQYAA